jgi:ATP-binding cassette subfamily F protein uup
LVADYKGTVVVVSHDRDFLDRTVTRTIGYEGDGRWQVYAGGYSDMVDQRGQGVQKRETVKAEKPKPKLDPTKTGSKTTKLSYKHKHRLEKLPSEMAALQEQIAQIQTKLADADLFSRDPDGFNAAAKSLEAAQKSLEAKETEWLELEIMRDEAGG